MINGVKHIIFDLGGVILNIDYQRTQDAFKAIGLDEHSTFYSKDAQNELFDLLETGKIDTSAFITAVQSHLRKPVNPELIIDAWNAIILDFPLRRLQLLQQLQLHYDTFLLSNTNEIHEKAFNAELQRTCGYPNLGVFFNRVYLSHRVGLRKPNPEIFQLVLQENHLNPQATLFIDDSIQHIESAKKLGIQTIHLCDPMTIIDIFKPVSQHHQ
jgi:glucose-1-phosphatase